jgi:heme a synthase
VKVIRWTAGVAAVMAYGIIVLGALVRSTNSGLSCPDWPTCYGQWVLTPDEFASLPYTGYAYWQVMLEWVHRLLAGVVLGPLILVLGGLAVAHRRSDWRLVPAAAFLLLVLLAQGVLGGITVLDQNSPWSVALHLGNALVLLTALLWFVVAAGPKDDVAASSVVLGLAALSWVLALCAMVTAAMTAKSGASLACATWPLCNGEIIPDLGDSLIRIHFLHRVLAAGVGLGLLGLFAVASRASAPIRRLAGLALLLVVAQIGLGALLILFQVPIWKAVLHQGVGVLTFSTVTVLFWRAWIGPPDREQTRGLAPGRDDGLALRGA